MRSKRKKRNFTECELETLVNEVEGVKNYYLWNIVQSLIVNYKIIQYSI